MKILVTAEFTDDGIRRLEALGMEVIYEPWTGRDRLLLSDEMAERLKELGAEAVILEIDLCHEEVFEENKLKFVGCCRGDPINVDVEEATDAGTPVFFTPGRNADAVADLTVGAILCYERNIVDAAGLLKSGNFDPETPKQLMKMLKGWAGHELGTMAVGIVGLGAVGAAVAKRLSGFGCRMLGYDPFLSEGRFQELCVEKASLEELFKESDIVTIHAAINDDTEGMITKELIDSMREDAVFVNLARAELVDNEALVEALREKRIRGAVVDVFMSEPPRPDDPFINLDNVLATPHMAGMSKDIVAHQTETIMADVERFMRGEKPKYCANPEVLE